MKRRRSVLRQAKGFRFGRGTKERQAKEAIRHAQVHAFNHRKTKKRDFRRLWQVKINAAVREHGLSYSVFIDSLKKKGVTLNRKMLAGLAEHHPDIFSKVVAEVK